MDINVFMAVMLAAILHSGWNGMVKKHKDKVISVSAIVFGPIPLVGALRESGIIFSIIIGIFFLNEKISIYKIISIILIFLGVVGLKIF